MPNFTPPPITFNILNLVEQIGEQIGRLSAESSRQQILQLRRISTIKTIQGSLAIEGNTLSVEQVTAVLDGKRVLASQRDIQEGENAIEAYDRMENWNPSFFLIPLESVIRDYQAEYYSAFNRCNQEVHPGIFVEFMLELILKTLQTVDTAYMTPVTPSVTPPVAKLLRLLQIYGALGNRELLEMLQLKDRRRMRETYINPAKKQEFIEYTIPDKPTSRNQQYRLTPKGRQLIEELKEN